MAVRAIYVRYNAGYRSESPSRLSAACETFALSAHHFQSATTIFIGWWVTFPPVEVVEALHKLPAVQSIELQAPLDVNREMSPPWAFMGLKRLVYEPDTLFELGIDDGDERLETKIHRVINEHLHLAVMVLASANTLTHLEITSLSVTLNQMSSVDWPSLRVLIWHPRTRRSPVMEAVAQEIDRCGARTSLGRVMTKMPALRVLDVRATLRIFGSLDEGRLSELMPALESLAWRYVSCNDPFLARLPRTLRHVSLSGSIDSDPSAPFSAVIEVLQRNVFDDLRELCLMSLGGEEIGPTVISKLYSTYPHLKVLDLRQVKSTCVLDELLPALASFRDLTELRLCLASLNRLSDGGDPLGLFGGCDQPPDYLKYALLVSKALPWLQTIGFLICGDWLKYDVGTMKSGEVRIQRRD